MPVNLDVHDFKCFNQLRNGEDFSANTSSYTPNLVGNVGEKVKVQFSVNLQQYATTEGSETWSVDPVGKVIERQSGSFLDDAFQIGTQFKFMPDWANRLTVSPEYTGTVTYLSGDGKRLIYTVDSGSDTTSGDQTNIGLFLDLHASANLNTALFLKFGLIGNDESFNYVSKVTEAEQVYYVSGLGADNVDRTAQSLGSIKDWVTGSMTVKGLSAYPTGAQYGCEYVISHEFVINPFYILAYRSFIDSETVPDLLAGSNSLKYAFAVEFRKTLTDTGSSKVIQFDSLGGFTGWYGENFNGLNNSYFVQSVAYEDSVTGDPLQGINLGGSTKATIEVSQLGTGVSNYSVGAYLLKLPKAESDYQGTKSDMLTNFLAKSEIVSNPATSSTNLSTSLSGGVLTLEYTIEYTAAEKLLLTTDDEYLLLVQIEDPTKTAGNSDRCMLIADLKNYVESDFVGEFINVSKYEFLTYGFDLGVDAGVAAPELANEDGILLNAIIGADTTKDVVISSIVSKLIAYNSTTGDSFELDSFDFNIGDPVLSGSSQIINVDLTRGYPLAPGDQFNFAKIIDKPVSGDFKQFEIQLGQKIKWQDWQLNTSVNEVFYDATKPNNNLNNKSSNYSGLEGYSIKTALEIEVSGTDDLGRSTSGTYVYYGGDLTVQDYDESPEGVTGVIETFDVESGNALAGDILYNGKDTLFKSTFENAASMETGIHRIEPSQNTGDGIYELYSDSPAVSNNLLKPIAGETYLKFTKTGSQVVTECLIDGSKIQDNVNYKMSARLLSGPPSIPQNLVSTVAGANVIAVSWDSYTGVAASFTIQYATDSGFTTGVGEVTGIAVGDTSKNVTGLAADTTYYFRMKAVSGSLESDWSNIDSAKTYFELQLTTTASSSFTPVTTYTGIDTPKWVFENGYVINDQSVDVSEFANLGLDGSSQAVKFWVVDKTQITLIDFIQDSLQGTLDLSLLSGVTYIRAYNNNLTGFDFYKGAGITRIDVSNNNISSAINLNGCGFSSAYLDFSSNNISSLAIAGTTGTISTFYIDDNALTGGINLDSLSFTSGVYLNISNNAGLTSFTFTQAFTRLLADNCAITSLDLSGATATGSNVYVQFSNNAGTLWSPPSMPSGTLAKIDLSGNVGLTGSYTDSWVSAYNGNTDVYLTSTNFSSITISATGEVYRQQYQANTSLTTLNLAGASVKASGFTLSAYSCTALTSFSAPSSWAGAKIILLDLNSNTSLTGTLDLSGLDFVDSSSSSSIGKLVLSNHAFTNVILPTAISHPIRQLSLGSAVNDSIAYDLASLGTGSFDQNASAVNLSSSIGTISEVNRMLVEIDGISSGGFTGRSLDFSGSNPAPDSTSGGYNGTAAVSSLVSKGFTVITS